MIKKRVNLIVVVVSIIIGLLLILSVISFFVIRSRNKDLLDNQSLHIVIYQYHVNEYKYDRSKPPVKIYDEVFTKELFYETRIVAIDNSDRYSVVQIKEGIVRVIDTNCYHEICKHSDINIEGGMFNNTSIQCFPNGLEIILEVVE